MISQINKVILKSLETGDKYGLEIIKDIQEFTNNRVVLKQPSLYSALRRMEKRGLIDSFWEDSELGGRRHYYSLSQLGRDELKADSVVSEEDIQSILSEVNRDIDIKNQPTIQGIKAPVVKNKVTFEQFDPREKRGDELSFSQKVRNSNQHTTIQEKVVASPVGTNQDTQKVTPVQEQANANTGSFWRESLIKENEQTQPTNDEFTFKMDESKPSRFEINYKDILGDLDADKPTTREDYSPKATVVSQSTERQEQQQRAKEYSSQISQLFASNKNSKPEKTTITKEQEELRNAIFKRQNQSAVDEINRRYNIHNEGNSQNHTKTEICSENYSNLTKVSPTDIEVKQYVCDTGIISSNEKEFININKLVLTRSIITAFFFVIAVLISYFVFSEQNLIYAPHTILYWIALGAVAIYLGIVLAITLSNFNKKVQLKRINWFVNLFYRALIAVALFTLVIALCLCFGMTDFMQFEFFTIWYLAALAIGDILVSWLIGYIIYSTKAFRE